MALGSDGRLTTAGHDGYALFVAGLENLAHWDKLDDTRRLTHAFMQRVANHLEQSCALSDFPVIVESPWVSSFPSHCFTCPSFRDDSLDDESYSSYRCRQHPFNTIHASLILFRLKFVHCHCLTTFANFLRTDFFWWSRRRCLLRSLTVGVCHTSCPPFPLILHDETTQTKDKHMSKLALLAKTRQVMTDQSFEPSRFLPCPVSSRCWWILKNRKILQHSID